MYKRIIQLPAHGKGSCFLWGPRQTGKSTLLKNNFPDALYYDLLLSDEYLRLNSRPYLLREEILSQPKGKRVIIDEIQKIPILLDEIHWLIANKGIQFILCGSSPRKLIRNQGNLLGGRARRKDLFPLVFPEIKDFNLERALNSGLLPSIYSSSDPKQLQLDYVGNYLKEEISQEALSRNIPVFTRFLEAIAITNGEMVNFSNFARECGLSVPSVKSYFDILCDTLLGRFVPSFQKRPKRRVVQSPKFYFFDVGIVGGLLRRGKIEPRTELFGKAFEHFILNEIIAHSHYSGLNYPVCFWRTTSQLEVDFILGTHELAIEVKGSEMVQQHHVKGLVEFGKEYKTNNSIIVSLDKKPRQSGNISILPWKIFLEKLWGGELLK